MDETGEILKELKEIKALLLTMVTFEQLNETMMGVLLRCPQQTETIETLQQLNQMKRPEERRSLEKPVALVEPVEYYR